MSHEPGSVHARLRDTATHAWRLYCALEIAVPHRPATGFDPGRSSYQRPTAAAIPWNTTAAELTLDFHNEIRRIELHLKERITGGYPTRRGSSRTNTHHAINSVVNLCETADQGTTLGVLGYLTKWSSRADTVFHPEHGLHRLPRQPGEDEARCPYCHYATLRWHPARGLAVCVNPACRNHSNQRPRWTAEFTYTDNQVTFRWDELETAA